MSKAIGNRDEGKAKQEAADAKVTTLTAQKEDLTNDIAELGKAIAANKKALNEATELRNDEKADNEESPCYALAEHRDPILAKANSQASLFASRPSPLFAARHPGLSHIQLLAKATS